MEANYAVEKTTELPAIDSPTGYTTGAEDYVPKAIKEDLL